MTRVTALLATGWMLWTCAGCSGVASLLGRPRPCGNEAVRESVQASGGHKAWRKASSIHAQAIVTLYDKDGTATVNRQEQVIDLRGGRLWASAREPEGTWSARTDDRGHARFDDDGADVPEALQGRLLGSLGTMLHRLRGPMNLCGYGEKPGETSEVRVDGKDLIRVGATGGRADVKAYYFDAKTHLLQLVTAGGDKPGQDGTVTVYGYDDKLPNGLAMPTRLAVVKIGKHVLVGDQPVLKVRYSNLRF